jgi:hypothetical protein
LSEKSEGGVIMMYWECIKNNPSIISALAAALSALIAFIVLCFGIFEYKSLKRDQIAQKNDEIYQALLSEMVRLELMALEKSALSKNGLLTGEREVDLSIQIDNQKIELLYLVVKAKTVLERTHREELYKLLKQSDVDRSRLRELMLDICKDKDPELYPILKEGERINVPGVPAGQ